MSWEVVRLVVVSVAERGVVIVRRAIRDQCGTAIQIDQHRNRLDHDWSLGNARTGSAESSRFQ